MSVLRVRFIASAFAAYASFSPLLAQADSAYATASTSNGPTSPPTVVANGPIIAEAMNSYSGMTASGSAFLDLGILRASAKSIPGLSESVGSAQISALVTFQGGAGDFAYLDYSFDGSLSLFGDSTPHGTFGKLLIDTSGGGYRNITLAYNSSQSGCATPGECFVGTSIAVSGSVPILISPGQVSISMSLIADAQYGDSANFSNTSKFFLRTPNGVTFSSAGGQFLVNASPLSPVPEPSIYLLFSLGIVVLTFLRTRGFF